MLLRAAAGGITGASVVRRSTAAAPPTPRATPASTPLIGYAFNVGQQSVTLFDPASLRVTDSYPIGAMLRWLSNEQRFWDGSRIWSYDFPDNEVQALSFNPAAGRVDRRLSTGGAGPSHSLMLSADNEQLWLNVAGSDEVVVLRKANGDVLDRIKTGAFP